MPAAVAEYVAARDGAQRWMLGRFIVPASRLHELIDALPAGAAPLALSVIVDAGADARVWFGAAKRILDDVARVRESETRVAVEALEVPLPALLFRRETYDATIGQFAGLAAAANLRDLPAYLEIPRDDRWPEILPGTMSALARARMGGKLRCGGVSADAFPSPLDVASFVRACAVESVPFKATAGLHHPIRHLNEATGFTMHGFLNLVAAAALARDLETERLEMVLGDEDPRAFAFDERGLTWRGERVDVDRLTEMRKRGFVGYGSCSFSEPVEDLTALGMLAKTE